MNLSTAITTGHLAGFETPPDKHIETFMSDVYLYPERVIKVFKHQHEELFGDLTNTDFRRQFFTNDFSWNQQVSPEIHLELQGVKINENKTGYLPCSDEEAEDFYITMQRVNDADTLRERLQTGTVSEIQIRQLTIRMINELDVLTEQHLAEYEDLRTRGWISLFEERLEDLRVFQDHIGDPQLTERHKKESAVLRDFFTTHPYFSDQPEWLLTIDNHCGNIVFVDESPQFIDIYLPKPAWRLVDAANTIGRLAACVRVLGGNELADAMYDEYAKQKTLAPRAVYAFYENYNAQIKAYYYTLLGEPELAEKFFKFVEKQLPELQSI